MKQYSTSNDGFNITAWSASKVRHWFWGLHKSTLSATSRPQHSARLALWKTRQGTRTAELQGDKNRSNGPLVLNQALAPLVKVFDFLTLNASTRSKILKCLLQRTRCYWIAIQSRNYPSNPHLRKSQAFEEYSDTSHQAILQWSGRPETPSMIWSALVKSAKMADHVIGVPHGDSSGPAAGTYLF